MNRVFKCFGLINVIVFFFLIAFSNSLASITAQPGIFDHIEISIPSELIAGKESKIYIYAFDALGNPIDMPSENARNYKVVATGLAKIEPSFFKSSDIKKEGFPIRIYNEKAEEITISLYEGTKASPIIEKRVKVVPAEINHLEIKSQLFSRAGDIFEIFIKAKDRYNNTVCKDYNPEVINLFFKGDISIQIKETKYIADQCVLNVKLYADKIGSFQVEASLLNSNIKGKSDVISIVNSELAGFIIEAPKEVIASESFEIKISAIDKFNNYVRDLSTKKQKFIIESTSKRAVFPNEISSHEFLEGIAKISLRYDSPDDIKIVVKDSKNSAIKGESDTIKIVPPSLKRFEIVAPETVIAGQKFKIKIIAYNQSDKIMTQYNLYGKPVILRTTGKGTLTPNKIPPSEFINGIAIVEVLYDKAEQFEIIASAEEEALIQEPAKYKEEKKKTLKKVKDGSKKSNEKKIAKVDKKPIEALRYPPLELKNISLTETKNSSKLILYIPQIERKGGYKPITKKEGKKMSIILEIYPVENKIEAPLKIDSEFIQNVSISQEKNKVIMNIELKKPLKYHVTKKKDEILIDFRRN